MKQVPIKLGPLALLLSVISICLTILAILTFTTARADMRLAERYAATVRDRYALETRGQEFLAEAMESASDPFDLLLMDDIEIDQNGYAVKTIEEENATLTIALGAGEDGSLTVRRWKIERQWPETDDHLDVWLGE